MAILIALSAQLCWAGPAGSRFSMRYDRPASYQDRTVLPTIIGEGEASLRRVAGDGIRPWHCLGLPHLLCDVPTLISVTHRKADCHTMPQTENERWRLLAQEFHLLSLRTAAAIVSIKPILNELTTIARVQPDARIDVLGALDRAIADGESRGDGALLREARKLLVVGFTAAGLQRKSAQYTWRAK